MAGSRRITLADLGELRWAMEPAAHPSEPMVAYVVSGLDETTDHLRYELFVSDSAGKARVFQRGARAPRWASSGDRIGFSRRDGDRWIPAVRSLSGEEWDLEVPNGDLVDLRWDHRGHRLLAVTATSITRRSAVQPYRVASTSDWDPGVTRSVWIVEPGAEPLLVADGLGETSVADWSPDGSRVAVTSDDGVDRDTSTATGLWVWSLETGESQCLVPPTVPIHAIAWSPDGASIAYLAGARDNAASALNELWIVDLGSRTPKQLGTGLDRSLGKAVRGDDERGVGLPILAWSPDAASLTVVYAEGGRSLLARIDTDGVVHDMAIDERCVLEFSSGDAGIAYSWSDPLTPGEISWLDSTTGLTQQITHVSESLLSDVELAPTTRISATASDGVSVEGWLTVPTELRDAPLVLQVHGGPHYAIGERFSFDAQRLAARGIALLRANPRGSQGYGQAFADGNLGDWGGRDLEDLMELVDTAIETASLDPERTAIIGESYGGYIAAWAAGTSDRFAAAVVESGIADFLSSVGGAVGPTFWYSELGGAPWENPSLYLERSPITRLDRVTAPVLVIHCENDATCAISQGEAIHAGLRELGRPVEFLRVPEEGHFFNVFGALSRRLERTAALDAFLLKNLGVDAQGTDQQRNGITS